MSINRRSSGRLRYGVISLAKLLLATYLSVNLTSCAETVSPTHQRQSSQREQYVLRLHINKDGSGRARVEIRNIALSTSKKSRDDAIADLRREFEGNDPQELRACRDIRRTLHVDEDGVWATEDGVCEDIFSVFRTLDSAWPHKLRRDVEFSIVSKGTHLAFRQRYACSSRESRALPAIGPETKAIITTSGTFIRSSLGVISEDRKTLTISDYGAGHRSWRLEMDDLGIDRPY